MKTQDQIIQEAYIGMFQLDETYTYKEIGLSANPNDISHAIKLGSQLIGYKKDKSEAHEFVKKANAGKWSAERALIYSKTGK